MRTFWVSSFAASTPRIGEVAEISPSMSSSIDQLSEDALKRKHLIQWNVDVLLRKLKLLVAHREASRLLQHLPGMEQVQSASTAIMSLPGVEQVSSASSTIFSLPGIKQTSSAIRHLPGQASHAILSLPGLDHTHRRPSLAMNGHMTLEEVQGIIEICATIFAHQGIGTELTPAYCCFALSQI